MNCSKIFTIAVIAATAVFAANKADAVMGVVNISATATFELDATPAAGTTTFKTVKKSIKTADALALLATATGNSWFTASGSKLMFDPDAFNQEATDAYGGQNVYGIFWVTNSTTHQAFRLDGLDGLSNYFSYVELDFAPWVLGFSAAGALNENGVYNGKYVLSPYQYTSKITGNATFYIHDNPYDFDYSDNLGGVVFDNDFAIVLTGPTTYGFSYKFDGALYPSKNSFSLKGSGDGIWNDGGLIGQGYLPQPVCSGSVKHSDSGKEEFDTAPAPF